MNFNDYLITSIYPEKPEEPILDFKYNSEDLVKHLQNLQEYMVSMTRYQRQIKVCQQEDQTLMQKFKSDVLQECGLSSNPESESIYLQAWQRGHTYGLSEVYSILKNMGILETVT